MNPEVSGQDRLYEVLAWLEVNKKRLILATGAVLLVGFGIYAQRHFANQAEFEASDTLLRLHPFGSRGEAPPVKASEYLKVYQQRAGTSAGERALLLAAGAFFEEKDFAQAQAHFDRFVQSYGSHPLAPEAAYGSAASIEAQGKANEAFTAYQNLVTRYPNASVVGQAKLALARLNEAKEQHEQALKLYDDLAKPGVGSVWASEAAERRAQLYRKFPNLDPGQSKTNTPRVTLTRLGDTNGSGTNLPKIVIGSPTKSEAKAPAAGAK